jgi:hypothetical protein
MYYIHHPPSKIRVTGDTWFTSFTGKRGEAKFEEEGGFHIVVIVNKTEGEE